MISSLTYGLFVSFFFDFQTYREFSSCFLKRIFSLLLCWSENIMYVHYSPIYSQYLYVLPVLENKVYFIYNINIYYIIFLFYNILYMFIKSILVMFSILCIFIDFFLLVLSVTKKDLLKSTCYYCWFYFLYCSLKVCFIYFKVILLST